MEVGDPTELLQAALIHRWPVFQVGGNDADRCPPIPLVRPDRGRPLRDVPHIGWIISPCILIGWAIVDDMMQAATSKGALPLLQFAATRLWDARDRQKKQLTIGAYNAMGGVGCISVTANVAPKLCSDFQKAMREGHWKEALRLQDRLYPLHAALFTDASPGPTKYALSRVRPGFPAGLRLPLTEPSEASKRAVDAALAHAGLV